MTLRSKFVTLRSKFVTLIFRTLGGEKGKKKVVAAKSKSATEIEHLSMKKKMERKKKEY